MILRKKEVFEFWDGRGFESLIKLKIAKIYKERKRVQIKWCRSITTHHLKPKL